MNNKTDSREKILTTASRLFQLKGYNTTGLSEILKESNSPKGSLYYYFPTGKEELGIAINLMIEGAITVSVAKRDVSALLVVSTQIELLLNN